MAQILVVHAPLPSKGGGEAVCMHVLEALQDEHELTVLSRPGAELDDLNEYYSTAVSGVDVRFLTGLSGLHNRVLNGRFGRVELALLSRDLQKRHSNRYDLFFSTFNDLPLPNGSIQYLHQPNFARTLLPGEGGAYPALVYSAYDRLLDAVQPQYEGSDAIYLTNSDWMAEQVTEYLGARPRTVYPPVDTTGFDPAPWSEREDGFVSIGRAIPEKRLLRNIDIVAKARERGHDVHYHVVGPIDTTSAGLFWKSYGHRVRSAADDHEFVHIEDAVSRDRLVELVSTHRYGLHGMQYEHFGIAVAELLAGGAIPFVPRGGGQQEIVGHHEAVMYDSVGEAVEKIDAILSDEDAQARVRAELPDVEERFGRARFHDEIRRVTEEALS